VIDEIIDVDMFEIIDVDKEIIEKMKMMLDNLNPKELESEKNET